MAKNPETVKKFLADMSVKLQPIWEEEKNELLKLKEEEVSFTKKRNSSWVVDY